MFPYLNDLNSSRDMIDVFYGYNRNGRIRENEFSQMKNMSSDKYPMLATRKLRGVYRGGINAPSAMLMKDDVVCYVDSNQLIIRYPDDWDEGKKTRIIELDNSDKERRLVSMGAYVIVLPDKRYVNITDISESGVIDNTWTLSDDGVIYLRLCQEDGTEYKNEEGAETPGDEMDINGIPVGIKAPAEPANGVYWVDTVVEESPMLKRWAESTQAWVPITTTFVKIISEGISEGFFEGDGVNISGIHKDVDGIKTLVKVYRDTENDGKGDYIIIQGMTPLSSYLYSGGKISRTMPELDFVCESGNRLWGCKYGSVGGKFLNEIYACKLGDFRNWNSFEGLSTDSYAVSCGTDGPFTAAVSYGGRPIFFKENGMHMIYGSFPAEYQTVNTVCRGVQEGCDRSLAIVNEVLIYKSRAGIMTYDGSLPMALDNIFGAETFDDAVACGLKNKYYISMRNTGSGEYGLYVYDVQKNLWHKEDNLHALWMCASKDNAFYVDAEAETEIRTIFGNNLEESVEWQVVTGRLGLSYPDSKYISRITIRAELGPGAKLRVYIQYDNENVWRHLYTKNNSADFNSPAVAKNGSCTIPIKTRRCDSFRLKLEGVGAVDIISISKTIETGSDFRGGL